MSVRQFEPNRAVEVIFTRADSTKVYGSGYRIGGGLVLTAKHLLEGDIGADCTVRWFKQNAGKGFEKNKIDLQSKVVWKAQDRDIALVELRELLSDKVEPIVLGKLPKDKNGEEIEFRISGYPRLGVIEGVAERLNFRGTINLGDSVFWLRIKEELSSEYSKDSEQPRSEWEGMSGAAVICDGLVVGVQMRHQRPQQPNHVEASPLWEIESDEHWQQLLEKHGIHPELEIARVRDGYQFENPLHLTPGFDIEKYRNSLKTSYGFLKLSAISNNEHVGEVKLWEMFIEPSVREALPPLRYDLPLDVKRQLQEQGRLENDLSSEVLEQYRRQYLQQPLKKVLAALKTSRLSVILGYPGAGKSTLLQFIALEWVEGKMQQLPLLIELREYVIDQSENFLEFLHRGRGADWKFDQKQLDLHLKSHPTLVMFDGLDEVFDHSLQSTVTDEIIRFAHEYPQARVLITSRIIGYNPDRLRQSEFRHFTIQPLNQQEIHEFIDRWYSLALSKDSNQSWLADRLVRAIDKSKPIQDLADNPLLLTMMAILNQEKELPSDRLNLYDQASQVLLSRWDVDHKRLQLPINTIGNREKKEMLCLIAYEMQVSDQGLKTNLITDKRLTQVVTNYLYDERYSEPREKANQLIKQLQERNFILCYRGAETYGFVHRTFLEYFCAFQIVRRLEQEQTLTFEQLQDEVFEPHFQDETWHEVLRLVASMIDVKLAKAIVDYLMHKEYTQGNLNKFLAAKCVADIGRESEFGYKYGLSLMNFWEDFTI